ncbi:cell division protein FtsL [Deinococcus metalli]|uniref:Cell division protein FtsL n=1 Tax=Deinococcus metalli TaxID=1141878 RepID=A0A7W8KHJ0_9DEIO|nr:hypothetical protein [Deinococcus metalli]MBB5378297.1 cell division protein FtsL [Deinococcus metalli]GHF57507.1 hypothetical protein GCM10017781_37360 [Deinococcus metalli]
MTRLRRPGLPTLDTSAATWRGRALRYLLIYLLLLVALVAVRYLTKDVRTTLKTVTDREARLTAERSTLAVEVQSLSNGQRVREWAFANGMHRFAEAEKVTQPIPTPKPAAVPAAVPSPRRTVEVRTQWK